jgi:HSP20 family protein
VVVRPELPGVNPEAVKIEVDDDILTIRGEHKERSEHKEEDYVRRERRCGSLSRPMARPGGVDAEKIKGSTRGGVVEVTVPFLTEASGESESPRPSPHDSA